MLRELYLVPFEACVREAGAALVMAAYNKVNGVPMTEHAQLLRDVLKDEWGFDGVVTSDWHAARSTAATALAALDLAMPGPDGPWGVPLAQAVTDGAVAPEVLDDKVLRLLRLARRVGAVCLGGTLCALGTPQTPMAPDPPACPRPPPLPPARPTCGRRAMAPAPPPHRIPGHRSIPFHLLVDPGLLRRAVTASLVLLRNERQALPIDPAAVGRVAVIGPNAVHPAIHGGGSAVVIPVTVSTPAAALTEALAGQAEVTVAQGVPDLGRGARARRPARCATPSPASPACAWSSATARRQLLAAEHRTSTALTWWDRFRRASAGASSGRSCCAPGSGRAAAGRTCIGAAGVGHLTVTVDGVVVADAATAVPDDPVEAMARPGEVRAAVLLEAGRDGPVGLVFRPAADGEGPLAVQLGLVAAATTRTTAGRGGAGGRREADAAVVVVGSARVTESEGFDRSTLALSGRQDELVRRVAAVNPRTVVVVNAGMPVLMPWADQVAAVIYAWLPGQAMGEALADVLLGRAEPGGRLPVTLPAPEADCPVLHAVPRDGRSTTPRACSSATAGMTRRQSAPQFAVRPWSWLHHLVLRVAARGRRGSGGRRRTWS